MASVVRISLVGLIMRNKLNTEVRLHENIYYYYHRLNISSTSASEKSWGNEGLGEWLTGAATFLTKMISSSSSSFLWFRLKDSLWDSLWIVRFPEEPGIPVEDRVDWTTPREDWDWRLEVMHFLLMTITSRSTMRGGARILGEGRLWFVVGGLRVESVVLLRTFGPGGLGVLRDLCLVESLAPFILLFFFLELSVEPLSPPSGVEGVL
jgi:hypothetical protein